MDFPRHWSNAEILAYEQRAAEVRTELAERRQVDQADIVLLSPQEMLYAVENGLTVGLGVPAEAAQTEVAVATACKKRSKQMPADLAARGQQLRARVMRPGDQQRAAGPSCPAPAYESRAGQTLWPTRKPLGRRTEAYGPRIELQ